MSNVMSDPAFNEFVFHCMNTAPFEIVKDLSTTELKYFKSKNLMFKFSNSESIDKKLLMLARLGIQYSIVFSSQNSQLDNILYEVPNQYKKKGKRLELTKAMQEQKIFVMTSRDLLLSTYLAAQNSHGQLYVLDYDYLKIYQILVKHGMDSMVGQTEKGMEALDKISKIILHSMVYNDLILNTFGISEYELRILIALFSFRNTFITHDKLVILVKPNKNPQSVSIIAAGLIKKGYVMREPIRKSEDVINKIASYSILEKGMNLVVKYFKYVLANTNY